MTSNTSSNSMNWNHNNVVIKLEILVRRERREDDYKLSPLMVKFVVGIVESVVSVSWWRGGGIDEDWASINGSLVEIIGAKEGLEIVV